MSAPHNHTRSRNNSSKKPRTRSDPNNAATSSSRSRQRSGGSSLVSVDFEVFGKVQGVYFRKYTQTKANELKLRGWCKNTERGSVAGCIQGERLQVDLMKDWLKRIGSPKCRIDGSHFKQARSITEVRYDDFQIRK